MKKMKNQNDLLIELLDNFNKRINISNGYEYNNKLVPRVTSILSKCINEESLMHWANNLGFKKLSYKKTLQRAANIGTLTHDSIDKFLSNDEVSWKNDSYIESINAYNSFLKWYNELISNNKVEILYTEYTLKCKYFGGTLDGLYKINDKIYLIDYKTSNRVRFNYTLQLAAYRYMLRELLNINIDGCIILQLSKNSIGYNEFVYNFDNESHLEYMNECETAFLSLVYAYYNIYYISERYDNLI